MDISSLTFAGLVAIGVVNVITIFKEDIDSRIKFILSLLAAFAVTFIPVETQAILYNKLIQAIEVAFAASGGYKLATKAGGV